VRLHLEASPLQLNLFREFKENPQTEEEKMPIVWEFLQDSLHFFENMTYKSVGKHMIAAWEKEMKVNGYIKDIQFEKVALPSKKNSLWVLIEFPFEGKKHISIWLDSHKTRLEDLKMYLKLYEQKAIRRIRDD